MESYVVFAPPPAWESVRWIERPPGAIMDEGRLVLADGSESRIYRRRPEGVSNPNVWELHCTGPEIVRVLWERIPATRVLTPAAARARGNVTLMSSFSGGLEAPFIEGRRGRPDRVVVWEKQGQSTQKKTAQDEGVE